MGYRNQLKEDKRNMVVLLSVRVCAPKKLLCVNPFCRHRTMMRINREIELVVKDSKGVHWADLPDHVVVVEHRCRNCGYEYKIYTPDDLKAQEATADAMRGENKVV